MSPSERLRWAVAPDPRRSALLLWCGLGAFMAAGALSTLVDGPAFLSLLLYLVLAWSWLAAACGAIGYLRWFLRQAHEDARKAHRSRLED